MNTNVANGGLVFQPPTGTSSNYYGVISGGGWIDKWGGGTAILSEYNTYTNWTSIYDGALQADSGGGLPAGQFPQSQRRRAPELRRRRPSPAAWAPPAANKFQWNTGGGGFSAGDNPMTVNIGSGTATLDWGTAVGSGIVGTLKFGSSTANNVTTFQNSINLNGADRTIYVEKNPNSGNDVAVISGAIVDISGPTGRDSSRPAPAP